ncbi:MAG: DUF3288 family protein [Cyanobium sp.]|nr:DUF3288 family protein [Cyanobium sp.]
MTATTYVGQGQTHPLYKGDRAICDRLLSVSIPSDQDLVDAARLLMRYRHFPGAFDIRDDLVAAAKTWGFASSAELNAATRAIWERGFRPQVAEAAEVGSGADVQAAAGADD